MFMACLMARILSALFAAGKTFRFPGGTVSAAVTTALTNIN